VQNNKNFHQKRQNYKIVKNFMVAMETENTINSDISYKTVPREIPG